MTDDTDSICGAPTNEGHPCQNPAGAGTSHKGAGKCWRHEDTRVGTLAGHAQRLARSLGLPLKPLLALILGMFAGAYIAHYPGTYTDFAEWLVLALGGGRALTRVSSTSRTPAWLSVEYIDTLLLGLAVGYLAVWWPHQGIDLIPVLNEWGQIA